MKATKLFIAALGVAALSALAWAQAEVKFSVLFDQSFVQSKCPSGEDARTFCLSVGGRLEVAPLEAFQMTRTAILPGTPAKGELSCPNPLTEARTVGVLTSANKDTIAFTGAGVLCLDAGTARYTYKITGGTGKFKGASGQGVIDVPPPTSDSAGTERWTGTLFIPGG